MWIVIGWLMNSPHKIARKAIIIVFIITTWGIILLTLRVWLPTIPIGHFNGLSFWFWNSWRLLIIWWRELISSNILTRFKVSCFTFFDYSDLRRIILYLVIISITTVVVEFIIYILSSLLLFFLLLIEQFKRSWVYLFTFFSLCFFELHESFF